MHIDNEYKITRFYSWQYSLNTAIQNSRTYPLLFSYNHPMPNTDKSDVKWTNQLL